MNRNLYLTIYGLVIVITGIILMVEAFNPSKAIRYTVAFGTILSAGLALLTASNSKDSQIPLKYHVLHAFILGGYGVAVLFFAGSIERFFSITTFFLLFYGMAEMFFYLQLLDQRENLKMPQVAFRLFLSFLISAGAAVVITISYTNHFKALIAAGIVFIITGINLILVKTVVKKYEDRTYGKS